MFSIILLFLGAGVIPAISGNQTDEMTEILHENEYANSNNVIYTVDTEIKETMDNNGGYIKIYDQPVEAPEEAQSPYAAVSAYEENTGQNFDYYVYENFWNVSDEISKIVWWGLTDGWDDGFIPGTPEGMNFMIEFYDDDHSPNNAPPTNLIDSFDVKYENLQVIHTGRYYTPSSGGDTELIKFEYELPSKISVSDEDGWICIWSYNDTEHDVFLWPRATEGDDFSYQQHGDPFLKWDVSFQLYKDELDETPPEVSIVQPKQSTIYLNNKELFQWPFKAMIIGSFDIIVDASDPEFVGMGYVEIFINNELKATLNNEPYKWTWSETGFGSYTIKAIAYDKADNSAMDEITVFKLF